MKEIPIEVNTEKKTATIILCSRLLFILVLVITGLGFVISGYPETTEELIDEIYDTAGARRVTPLYIPTLKDPLNFDLVNLSGEFLILTVTPNNHPPSDPFSRFHILAKLCKMGQERVVSDAVFLVKGETAKDFSDNNHRVAFYGDEYIELSKCMGIIRWSRTPGEKHKGLSDDKPMVVYWSMDRTLIYVNIWAKFFAEYEKDYNRARGFLMYSLKSQTDRLKAVSRNTNLKTVRDVLNVYDETSPLYLLQLPFTFSKQEIKDLRRYLEETIKARRKVKIFYPEHSKLLDRDEKLLQLIPAN